MRFVAFLFFLISLVSCTAHKLDVRLNGQPTQSMDARIKKNNGHRIIDLILPGGSWAVSAEESGVVPRIVELEGRKHVFVELPDDRMVSSKPILITLQGLDRDGKPSGKPYTVSLSYYNRQQKASPYT
jgi:hypothetical protein